MKTTRILFSSLVLTEDIRSLDPENCRQMLSALVETDLLYQNFAVTDLQGKVIASARPMDNMSLSDRKLESIGVLAGGIAHDFNNILAGILGNIDLVLFDKSIAEKPKKFLHGAVSACERARSLTHQLLTFARGGDPVLETAALAKPFGMQKLSEILHSLTLSFND